jgi:FkbM family methyltransferase
MHHSGPDDELYRVRAVLPRPFGVLAGRLVQLVRRLRRDARTAATARWFEEGGADTLRFTYALDTTSVVFDVGGYRGDFAAAMLERYGPLVHVFEPVPTFAERIARRFDGDTRVQVHPFALGDRDGRMVVKVNADASGMWTKRGTPTEVAIVDVMRFVADQGIDRIDLLKLNIEGGEFDLLDRMIGAGLVERCIDLQIQFHPFVPDARARRERIRSALARTHALTYDYAFVFENWHRNEEPGRP